MNQTTTFSSYSQNFDIHIHYIYYEVAGGNEMTENIVHAVQYQRIMDTLEEKGYIIHREDLIFLLKDDGASFYEDSLRLYDPQEDTYFKVPDEWEFPVDYSQPSFSLLIWIKSVNPNFRKRVEEVNENLKSLEDRMNKQIESLEAKSKTNVDTLNAEINKLKFSNQVLFQQLTKIYKEGAVPDAQAPAITNGSSSSSSAVETRIVKPSPETQLCLEAVFRPDMNNPDSIDIALMYSEPLVKRDEYGIISLGEPVNFEDECSKVLEILRKKEKRINMYFEIATVRHLVNVLSLSPTVLHIICHGDFNKERNQFFLCFEENGELFELYSGDLKTRLQEINFNTQVVFINACHSEGVARVFIDAGVPCVVAVHSELKIEDTIAQRFSESFYWQLFEGKTIEEAFRHARAAISGKDVYTCCCAHSHKPGCEWSKLLKNEGAEKAHHAHTPTCTDCFNKFGNKFEHKEDCMWAVDFLTLVCGHDELPEHNIHACCCSPELPHNEVMKFKLICRDEKFAKQVLWKHREKGTVSIKSTYSSTETKFSTAKITGRNRETYELFSFLTNKETKVVNLYGLDGVGKTTLAKQVGNYLAERGYFRDKMSVLMLEKTPSITYFRANLFKEITGSYDLKTFCESINSSKMLFILLKCDTLIKDNFDGFRQDLSFIMEYAPNVKFLIVTNDRTPLNIGESTVLMKELKKLDAAKLLVKNAYTYLPWDLRNVYNLAQHDVFDLISLTPQGIWAISEKLKNNKSLDEIERELAIEKEKHEENLPTVEMEETVLKILKALKEQYFDAYYVIICICLYPSGLSFTDMEELAEKGRITKIWKEILVAFLKKRGICNQYCPQELKEGEEEGKFDASCPIVKELKERNGKPVDRSEFKPDNYIWLNITKDAATGEVWFVPSQFIIKVVEKYLGDCFAKQTLKKFEYMAILSTSLINKIKKNYNYCEKLVEFSAVSTFGIWKLPVKGEMCMLKDADLIQYIEKHEYDFEKLKQWFSLHENNFFSCFDPDAVQRVISNKNIKEECVMEVMEILCLAVPTLFKIISPRGTGAMEAARRAQQILVKFNEHNAKISIIKIKLSLFLAALHMGAKIDIHENFTLAKIQLKITQEEVEKIKAHENAPLLFGIVAIGFAYYYYKGYKKNCLNPKDFPNKDAVNKQINNIFRKVETLAGQLFKTDEGLKVPKAKIALMKCKTRNRETGLEKQLLEDMREAVIILTEYKSLRLIMKAHYLYASLKIEIEKKKTALKGSENSSENIKNMTNRLVEIKYIHLIKTSLDIAKKIKDKTYEAKIKKKIDEINLEIRQKYFNVINIVRAAPIIDIKRVRGQEEAVPIGFPTRLASIFKHELLDALAESNKVLCMKFGVLTRKELMEAVHSGCRVLQINCTYSEPNCLCVETEFGVVDRITFDELRHIFTPKVCCNASKSSENVAALTEDAHFENSLLPKISACKKAALTEDAEFESKLLPQVSACKKAHHQAALTEDANFENELLPKISACKKAQHHAALTEDAAFESELLPRISACKKAQQHTAALTEDANFENELLPKISACKKAQQQQHTAALTEDAGFEAALLPKISACKKAQQQDPIALLKTTSLPEDTEFHNKLVPKMSACKAHYASSTDNIDHPTSLPEDAAFEAALLPKISACKKAQQQQHTAALTEDAGFEAALLPKISACKKAQQHDPIALLKTTSLPEDAAFEASLMPKISACKQQHSAMRYKTRSGEVPVDEEEEELTRESSSGIQHPPVQEGGKLVDVLILGVKNNKNLAELFVSLKIPHVITFDFVDVEINFRHKVYEDECEDMFSLYFYQELIAQKSVYDAFETARSKVFDYLGEKFFENKPQTYITQIIGRGPVLLPQGGDHSEILFGSGRFPLANGRIEDISNSTYPTNIEKMYIPYTGRRKDFYEIIPKLVQNRGIYELTGVPGIGKTAFALHVGYFILNRDIFTDGVFYIPLKTLRDKSYIGYQMKDLLRDTLGMDVQFGFLSQLKNKNMLLIFDDFDLLYDDEVEYCRLFFRAVKQCKIACIVITQQTTSETQRNQRYTHFNSERQQEITNEILDKDSKWELQGILDRDLLLLLQAFIKPEDDRHSVSVEELQTIDVVQQCEGNPKQLLDALLARKIKLGEKTLEINPLYKEELEFEQHYTNGLELLPMPSVHYSRYVSNISSISGTSDFRYSRGLSKHEPEFFHHPSSTSSGGSGGFRRGSIRAIGGGKSSDDSSSDFHKAKSFRVDSNSDYSDLSLNKNLSSIGGGSGGYPPMKRIDRHPRDHHHNNRSRKRSNEGLLGALSHQRMNSTSSNGDASTSHLRTPGPYNEKNKNLSLSNIEHEGEDSMMKSPDSFYVGDTERRHSDQEILGLKRVESKEVDTSKLKERKGSNFTQSNGEESLMEEERESSGEEDFNKDQEGKENEWSNNLEDIEWDIKSGNGNLSAGSNLENKIMRSRLSRRLGRPRITKLERKKGIFKPQKYRRMIYEQK